MQTATPYRGEDMLCSSEDIYMIKKTFTINEKNKDLGLLKKLQKVKS